MTREHKLALIVGFSLVLVLGVLISDHFSPARRNELAEDIKPTSGQDVGAVVQGVRTASEQGLDNRPPLPGIGTGGQSNVALVNGPAGPTQQGVPPSDQLRQLRPDMSVPVREPGMTISMGERPPLPSNSDSRDPSMPALAATAGQSAETLTMGDGSTLTPVPTPAASVQIPLQRHDVREGDTLYRIAVKYYGDGRLWDKIRDYNKDKVTGAANLREGVTLLLPPKDVLLGKPYVAPSSVQPVVQPPASAPRSTPDGRPIRPETRTAQADDKSFKEYVVKEGDTLSGVAKKTLGSTKRWPEIVAANRAVLSDEDSINVGMKLKIPVASR